MLQILLVEDHEIVRQGVKLLVDSQDDMQVVGEAANGEIAIKKVAELQPDIILMDVSMPELNGLKATKRIKKLFPNIKILTLTRHTDDGYIQQLIQAGANGYVLKQSAPNELINAIRVVAEGKAYLDPALTEKLWAVISANRPPEKNAAKVQMTDRETEVVRMIAWGYSNKEIAQQILLSVKTVEAHKANAMRKLGMSSRIDIVRYAILQGWMEDN